MALCKHFKRNNEVLINIHAKIHEREKSADKRKVNEYKKSRSDEKKKCGKSEAGNEMLRKYLTNKKYGKCRCSQS